MEMFRLALPLFFLLTSVCIADEVHLNHASIDRLGNDDGKLSGSSVVDNLSSTRRLVICLDGTWNGTYDKQYRDDGSDVLKPTNVLKMCRSVLTKDNAMRAQISYYATGVGSMQKYPGVSNTLLSTSDKYLGGVWGAGFESNIEAALNFLVLNYQEGDQVFIFGFSRGAATARGVTRFIDWAGGLPQKSDAYYLPELYKAFIISKGSEDSASLKDAINIERAGSKKPLPPLEPFSDVQIAYLGVWDTVMALGSRFRATDSNNSTISRSFFVDSMPAKSVVFVRQALAIDEERFDFRPEIWTSHSSDQVLQQRWFAGVHSNIGGGYLDDGLANIAFRWIIDGAVDRGLEIDKGFASKYRGFSMDRLYETYTLGSKIGEMIRLKFHAGRRTLIGYPDTANLSLDKSVIHRIRANPNELKADGSVRYPELGGRYYRPENVLQYLACRENLNDYLNQIGLDAKHVGLPADALETISNLQKNCTAKRL